MVKPNSFKASVDSQSWATGESSRGTWRSASGSPVTDDVPATATVGPKSPVTTATPASASEGSFLGFSVRWGPNGGCGTRRQGPLDLGLMFLLPKTLFSPLLGLGCEEGLCFGEKDDSTVGSGEKGVIWSNPIAQPVSVSQLDGVELEQEGPEHSLIQWKSRVVNPSDCFHGEDENGLLECSPLSKWDPNDHKGWR